MIENVKFENFRGFDHLELSKIKPITLISGKNNVGKSSVLEGIFLFLDHSSPDSFAKISRFRGMLPQNSVSLWEPVFYQMNTGNTMQIEMVTDGILSTLKYIRDDSFVPANDMNVPQDIMNQMMSSAKSAYTLRFQYKENDYTEDGHFIASTAGIMRNMTTTLEHGQIKAMPYTHFINATTIIYGIITEWYGKLELSGKKQQIIEILRVLDPRICDLSTIAANGQVMLYAKIDSQLLPLRLAGDGLNKLLFVILSIIANPNSIFLIDEIESGFHYTMYAKLWEVIAGVARENECQIIATTHSYECIAGAIDGIEKSGRNDDFCYFRIGKRNGKNLAHRYSDDLLRTAIDTEMEVR